MNLQPLVRPFSLSITKDVNQSHLTKTSQYSQKPSIETFGSFLPVRAEYLQANAGVNIKPTAEIRLGVNTAQPLEIFIQNCKSPDLKRWAEVILAKYDDFNAMQIEDIMLKLRAVDWRSKNLEISTNKPLQLIMETAALKCEAFLSVYKDPKLEEYIVLLEALRQATENYHPSK